MKANDGRGLFGYFVHAVQLVDYDVAWHYAVWVVDNQFWVVEIFAARPVHAVTAVGRAPPLLEDCVSFPAGYCRAAAWLGVFALRAIVCAATPVACVLGCTPPVCVCVRACTR